MYDNGVNKPDSRDGDICRGRVDEVMQCEGAGGRDGVWKRGRMEFQGRMGAKRQVQKGLASLDHAVFWLGIACAAR